MCDQSPGVDSITLDVVPDVNTDGEMCADLVAAIARMIAVERVVLLQRSSTCVHQV